MRLRVAQGAIPPTTIFTYVGIFLFVVAMIVLAYHPPVSQPALADTTTAGSTQSSQNTIDAVSVDQLVAVNLASSLATSTDLPVSTNIENREITLQIESQLAQSSVNTITKPQVLQPTANSGAPQQYVVQKGDTVDKLAEKFGVSASTIKTANNLSSNELSVGNTLTILPVDGIMYTVKAGDTIDSIVQKYGSNRNNIIAYNAIDPAKALKSGTKLVLPDGSIPAPAAPAAPSYYTYQRMRYGTYVGDLQIVNPYNYINANIYSTTTSAGYNGQCTWYAYFRRAAMGMPIPNQAYGNAAYWIYSLGSMPGHWYDSKPSVGAIIQNGGGYGHVGVVEKINPDGSILISEMNNYMAGGTYAVDIRTVPAYLVSQFYYIH